MNKRILSFAFISVAFLVSCTSDSSFSPKSPPPPWDGMPPSLNPSSAPSGGGGSGTWCVHHGYEMCVENSYLIAEGLNCADLGGVVTGSCPSGYDRD